MCVWQVAQSVYTRRSNPNDRLARQLHTGAIAEALYLGAINHNVGRRILGCKGLADARWYTTRYTRVVDPQIGQGGERPKLVGQSTADLLIARHIQTNELRELAKLTRP